MNYQSNKCLICDKLINSNEKIYRGFDNNYCSYQCRETLSNLVIKSDPNYNTPSKWRNTIKRSSSSFNVLIDELESQTTDLNSTYNISYNTNYNNKYKFNDISPIISLFPITSNVFTCYGILYIILISTLIVIYLLVLYKVIT